MFIAEITSPDFQLSWMSYGAFVLANIIMMAFLGKKLWLDLQKWIS